MKKTYFLLTSLALTFTACNHTQKNSNQIETTKMMDRTIEKAKDEMTIAVEKTVSTAKGYITNIEQDAASNANFRKVIYTGKHLQLVLMTLKPGEEIGSETHPTIDQFFRIESGKGKCNINGNEYTIQSGDVIIVPAGSLHNVINTDATQNLKLYTIYSPPQHQDAIIRITKKDAETNEEKYDGKTTE